MIRGYDMNSNRPATLGKRRVTTHPSHRVVFRMIPFRSEQPYLLACGKSTPPSTSSCVLARKNAWLCVWRHSRKRGKNGKLEAQLQRILEANHGTPQNKSSSLRLVWEGVQHKRRTRRAQENRPRRNGQENKPRRDPVQSARLGARRRHADHGTSARRRSRRKPGCAATFRQRCSRKIKRRGKIGEIAFSHHSPSHPCQENRSRGGSQTRPPQVLGKSSVFTFRVIHRLAFVVMPGRQRT